jgi:predicted outer membrane repeat protein
MFVVSSVITRNMTDGAGGGISSPDTTYGPVQISDSLIRDNEAASGGGIWVSQATNLILTRTAVLKNRATGDGGGIYYSASGSFPLDIIDSDVHNNSAAGRGGGIFATDADVGIQNSSVSANDASYGGGIYNDTAVRTLTLQTGTSIINNTATVAGGGLFNNGGTVAISPGVRIAVNRPDNCTGTAC